MDESEEDDSEAGPGLQIEVIRSYLHFATRAIKRRLILVFGVALTGIALTIAAFIYLPRTYSCSTVLMAVSTTALDNRDGSNALAGASDLVMRHENLEAIIRDTGLVEKAASRRPPLLHLKDKIITSLFGEMPQKTKVAALVGTLEAKIGVENDKGDLTIKAEWSDPKTAAEVAEAARESFLKARHTAEISAFEEKMSILESHAAKLREEVGDLAGQLKAARDERIARAKEERAKESKNTDAVAAPRFVRLPTHAGEPDEALPQLKEKLDSLKLKLATLESDRERRLRDEQAKLEDMKLRLTPSHPEVVTEGERVAILRQMPSDVALMRAEVKDLESEIQQRSALGGGGGGLSAIAGGRSKIVGADTLPPEITDLLQAENLDPALSAQLSGAVMRYGTLRNDVLSTRIDLDTAQAAFNHRYQIIVPAEVPTKADKPKAAAVLGGGFALALLFALLLPILSELRTGIIVERWQVEHIQLPVLAELRLPPQSSD